MRAEDPFEHRHAGDERQSLRAFLARLPVDAAQQHRLLVFHAHHRTETARGSPRRSLLFGTVGELALRQVDRHRDMAVLAHIGRDRKGHVRLDAFPDVRGRLHGVLRTHVSIVRLLVILHLPAGEHRLAAVERREPGRRAQLDRAVLLHRLQAGIKVRRHLSELYKTYLICQTVDGSRPERHVETRGERTARLRRLRTQSEAETRFQQHVLRGVDDHHLDRDERHGAVDRAQELLDAGYLSLIAAQDHAVQIAESGRLHPLFQVVGDRFRELVHRAVMHRDDARREQALAFRLAEHIDASLLVVGVGRAREQQVEQRFRVGVFQVDARLRIDGRDKEIVEFQLLADIEYDVVYVAPVDHRRDSPRTVHRKLRGCELPAADIVRGGSGRASGLGGRLGECPCSAALDGGNLQLVDLGQRTECLGERHRCDVARYGPFVQRLRDDQVHARAVGNAPGYLAQRHGDQVVAERRVGAVEPHRRFGRRSDRRFVREYGDDIPDDLHVQSVLLAQKQQQLVDAGPREVAAHRQVRPVAHAQVHTAHLGHRAQQLGERSLAHRQIHLAEVGFVAPGQRVEPGADRGDTLRAVGLRRHGGRKTQRPDQQNRKEV